MSTLGARSNGVLVRVAGIVAISFGILTIASGGNVLFGSPTSRIGAGKVVDFVLWFNFLSGFAYVGVGVGLFMRRPWAGRAAFILACAIIVVGTAFAAHVLSGGLYEARTVGAMTLRTLVWIAIAAIACRTFECFGPPRTL